MSGKSELNAEILWTSNVIEKHYSFRSCCNALLHDLVVVNELSCFGLSPYFLSLLTSKVKSEKAHVLLFDESLNRKLHSKQLDIHIRFWDAGEIATRYYSSEFLGHGTAEALHDKHMDIVRTIGSHGMLQLSIDGPNVKRKPTQFFQKI